MIGMRFGRAFGVVLAGTILFSSTGAIAAVSPMPTSQPDPWAVLSVMSGGASAAAVCGASVSDCALPQADTAAEPPAQSEPPQPIPVPPVDAPSGGLGIDPLLLGLVAVAGGVGLYFLLHSNSPS